MAGVQSSERCVSNGRYRSHAALSPTACSLSPFFLLIAVSRAKHGGWHTHGKALFAASTTSAGLHNVSQLQWLARNTWQQRASTLPWLCTGGGGCIAIRHPDAQATGKGSVWQQQHPCCIRLLHAPRELQCTSHCFVCKCCATFSSGCCGASNINLQCVML